MLYSPEQAGTERKAKDISRVARVPVILSFERETIKPLECCKKTADLTLFLPHKRREEKNFIFPILPSSTSPLRMQIASYRFLDLGRRSCPEHT